LRRAVPLSHNFLSLHRSSTIIHLSCRLLHLSYQHVVSISCTVLFIMHNIHGDVLLGRTDQEWMAEVVAADENRSSRRLAQQNGSGVDG
jgi:hypothetical protein